MEHSIREEIANAISHGINCLLSIGALAALILFRQYGDAWHIVSVSIFGACINFIISMLHTSPQHYLQAG
ncbi:hypothetical protein P7H19_18390 [Paenibacillus larvae]|nr:hypothetical protein [Paenibacillus larvae]MDT2237853.1 hypothetical protein [Paenibacillus larvae]